VNLVNVFWAKETVENPNERAPLKSNINQSIKLLNNIPTSPNTCIFEFEALEVNIGNAIIGHNLLPFLQPLRVVSVGIGVTSSIRPIFIPLRAIARRAD